MKTLYVAVVVRRDVEVHYEVLMSRTAVGDWKCFTGTDKEAVIQKAIEAVESWGESTYKVLVGTMSEEVFVPKKYDLKPLVV